MRTVAFALLSLFAVFCIASTALSVPNLISYQGVIHDKNGAPISAAVSMTFSIYDVDTEGTALWSEVQDVQVSNGLFNVRLGEVQPLTAAIFSSNSMYLGIKVGSDSEMLPRQRITPGPYLPAEIPVGSVQAWLKDLTGTPALADSWAECNGQVLDDSESPYDGITIPNLNGADLGTGELEKRFLRGNTTSGGVGGEEIQDFTHSHGVNTTKVYLDPGSTVATSVKSTNLASIDNRPPYYDVVWIIKIK